MYYVIQVAAGMEDKAEREIAAVVGRGLYDSCFHPMRLMKKKYRGKWKELHEKLLPGYVFITSNRIQELYQELKKVPAFTKLLGKEDKQFVSLSDCEVEWLERITEPSGHSSSEHGLSGHGLLGYDSSGYGMEVQLSQVSVSEEDIVTVLSGPLKNMEGCIKKIDLHRRIAKVEVDFMNRKTVIHLGIEMVGKKE